MTRHFKSCMKISLQVASLDDLMATKLKVLSKDLCDTGASS
jgi:hypothetical protein